MDSGADLRALEHVAKIADQAVGEVDRGASQARERQPKRNARLGPIHAPQALLSRLGGNLALPAAYR